MWSASILTGIESLPQWVPRRHRASSPGEPSQQRHADIERSSGGPGEFTETGRRGWAIEGSGSFGAGLATALAANEEYVIEFDHPGRELRLTEQNRMFLMPSERLGRPLAVQPGPRRGLAAHARACGPSSSRETAPKSRA